MKSSLWHRVAVFIVVIGLPGWSQANGVTLHYHETLQQLETQFVTSQASIDGDEASAQLSSLRFNAFGKHFDMQLAPNRSLLKNLTAAERPVGIDVYRGDLQGVPGSWARITYDGATPTGMFFDGNDMYAIERRKEDAETIVFRLSDLELAPGMMSCSVIGGPETAASMLTKVEGEIGFLRQNGPGATQNLDIALIADTDFTDDKGIANSDAEMITRMNNVDGIFSAQLGVQITVNRTDSFDATNDPFSTQTDSGTLLDEVSDYRNTNSAQNSNGLTHLFTGRNLDGSTVGIAYVSAICSRRFGVGLTQATNSVTVDTLIAAHELGHNFGAPHDGTSGSACESESQTFLMAPSINGSDTFSSCSITQMQDDVARASCVTDLPTTDVAVAVDETPATPLLGNSEQVVFAVDSVGTDDAASVIVDVTLPASVTLDSVSASVGSCTTGAGTANCDLGTIVAGSGATVSVTVTLDQVGDVDITADVTATSDTNTSNDQQTATINVAPAVDLAVTAPTVSNLTLDQAGSFNVTVENLATIAATGAQVTITPAAGLRLDSADWSAGDCVISGGEAVCDAASLAAQSTNTIALGVTGTAEGNVSYAVTASANETDRDSGNNDASASVTISEAAPPPSNSGGDSGGGSTSWLFLLVLLALFFSRWQQMRAVQLTVVRCDSQAAPEQPRAAQ